MAFGWCGAGSRTGVPEQWTCVVNIAPTPRERAPPYRSLRNLDGIPLSLSFWTVSEEEMTLETPGIISWCKDVQLGKESGTTHPRKVRALVLVCTAQVFTFLQFMVPVENQPPLKKYVHRKKKKCQLMKEINDPAGGKVGECRKHPAMSTGAHTPSS